MAFDKVVDSVVLDTRLTAVADAIRGKTGKTDVLTLDQMPEEIEGIQTGGGGSSFGENTVSPNFLNLFYAIENGTGVTGEFTLAEYLPNTETLIFDSGLSEINGLFYVDCDIALRGDGSWAPETGAVGFYAAIDGVQKIAFAVKSNRYADKKTHYVDTGSLVVRGKFRIDGGALYATADYNKSDAYSPFWAGHRYKWCAW